MHDSYRPGTYRLSLLPLIKGVRFRLAFANLLLNQHVFARKFPSVRWKAHDVMLAITNYKLILSFHMHCAIQGFC